MTWTAQRGPGRPSMYPDQALVKHGVSLRQAQLDRLHDYAAERRSNVSAVLREIVDQWAEGREGE
jgi:hypothetical protein